MIKVIQKHTDNFTKGEIPRKVKAIVIHIAQGSEASVDSWFGSKLSNVSSNFLVGLDGEIRQYVSVHDIPWANGEVVKATWKGLIAGVNPNTYTVSIEHEGSGLTPWPEEQLISSSLLSAWVCLRFGFRPTGLTIVKHNEIKATKSCPGKFFDRDNYLHRVEYWYNNFNQKEIEKLISGIR